LLRRDLQLRPSVTTPQAVELPLYDVQMFRLSCLVQLVSFLWLCGYSWSLYSIDIFGLFLLAYAVPLMVISTGADLYAAVRHINQLHLAHHRETWDMLRLAMVNDQEFVRTLEAIGVVKSWAALRLDLTFRAFPAAVVIFVSTVTAIFGGLLLILSTVVEVVRLVVTWLPNVGAVKIGGVPNVVELLTTTLWALVALRLATVFIGDPLLRFRLNAAFGMLCATAIRDTTTAIAVSIAGIVAMRLLHVIGIGILYNLTDALRLGRYPAHLSEGVSTALFIGWLAMLATFAVPLTSNLFVVLRGGFERLTLRAIQSGD
jgi:hypothetical protein